MEQFVKEEIALLAKEKGFNEPCNAYCRLSHVGENYIKSIVGAPLTNGGTDMFLNFVGVGVTNDNLYDYKVGRLGKSFALPTQSELQRWFHKNHKIHIAINYIDEVFGYQAVCTNINYNTEFYESGKNASPEDALDDALMYVLENIK